jgi:hypothetical protein
VREANGKAVEVLAACLEKFFNLGEPSEKKSHMKFLKRENVNILFIKKEDGVNIRPYFNPVTSKVEFATRSMPLGVAQGSSDEDDNLDFGEMARDIAKERYPAILTGDLVKKYSLIFEMIHPDSKIVTDYGDRKDLILIAAFERFNECRELPHSEISNLAMSYGLTLIENWLPLTPNSEFDVSIQKLQEMWDNSDHEGTVAMFVRPNGEPLYRLKIKNSYYLQLLRLLRYCTLKNLREMIELNNFETWEEIRAKLYETPSMSEELEMAYREHYENYVMWQQALDKMKQSLYNDYVVIPKYELQKEFAFHALQSQWASVFFEMRKFEQCGGEIREFWLTPNDKLKNMLEKMYPLGNNREDKYVVDPD